MSIYPTIPEQIVVHLGAPGSDSQNVTVPFIYYIQNVAASELYPTWPTEALKANIIAQVSVALNRIYTEYYRSRGYNFDITASTAYDQAFFYQRDLYTNLNSLVNELFNTYIRKSGRIEPLFAQFCDGIRVTCKGLSQWGSVDLAKQGYTAERILKYYFGSDTEIVSGAPVEDPMESYPGVTYSLGSIGPTVEILQKRLNRISVNFPGIPKINPTDGFFGPQTQNSVLTFQKVFGLAQDGIVGRNTWYSVLAVYSAVKKLYDLDSEGLLLSDFSNRFSENLKQGDRSLGVLFLQYYLSYIGSYLPSVPSISIDGDFGPRTKASVLGFQKTYGLPQTGIVDARTWRKIENVYSSFIESLSLNYTEGVVYPYPGRILYQGARGEDVRLLQSYIDYIANYVPAVPHIAKDGIFGPATERAVLAFVKYYGLPQQDGKVGAILWRSITNVYADLYAANKVRTGQFTGTNIE